MCTRIYVRTHIYSRIDLSQESVCCLNYDGVATIRRLLEITGLFCKTALTKILYFAKETYAFKGPNNRSHTIYEMTVQPTFQKICYHLHRYLAALAVEFREVFRRTNKRAHITTHCNTRRA